MSDHDIANKELEIFRSDAAWYQLYGFAEQVYTDLVFYEDDLGPHPDKELRAYQPIGAGFGSAQSDFQEACSARRYPKIETCDASNENVRGMVKVGLHVSVHCESWSSLAYPGVRFHGIRDASGPSHITFTACWKEHNRNPALARFLDTLRLTHHPTALT